MLNYSAANSCPTSPGGNHNRQRNVASDLHMAAVYAAAVVGSGSINTLTVGSSGGAEDRYNILFILISFLVINRTAKTQEHLPQYYRRKN